MNGDVILKKLDKKSKSKSKANWLFPVILIATLAQNFYDLKVILEGASLSLSTYEGPIVFKLLKDVVYIGLLWIVLRTAMETRRWPVMPSSLAFILLTFFSFLISLAINDFAIAVIGLRWIIPFLVFLLLRDASVRVKLDKGIFWLFLGLLLCLGAQIYQLFYMPPIYGEILGGWPARTPGIFLAPNSTAFFACSCCACLSIFLLDDYRRRIVAGLLALLISLLAQSGTGILTSVVLLIWLINKRYTIFSLIAGLIIGIIIFINLDAITMREDYVSASGGNRLDVLIDTLGVAVSSIANFGIYTNAGTLQQNIYAVNFAVDSLWASWFGNFGLLAPIQLIIVGFFFLQIRRIIDWNVAMPCVIVFTLFSMTTIIFEAYPMNLLLGIGMWAARKSSAHQQRSLDHV